MRVGMLIVFMIIESGIIDDGWRDRWIDGL
jgi:hypothetical protein